MTAIICLPCHRRTTRQPRGISTARFRRSRIPSASPYRSTMQNGPPNAVHLSQGPPTSPRRKTMSEDAHSRPAGHAPQPLYDVTIPTPTHAERARTLVAQISTGTLCTLAHEPDGYPYGSFVTVAFDRENPIFLISRLAEHTKNLERDSRASLLVAESRSPDPLANGRVTLLGPCTPVEGDGGSARVAFLAVHPNAAYYADFRDFGFWKLQVH